MKYKKHGLEIELPTTLKVRSDSPLFLAMSKDQMTSVMIEIDPPHGRRVALEELLNEPLGANPMLESFEVSTSPPSRLNVIAQRVVEQSRNQDTIGFGWALNAEMGGVFVHIQISSPGTFTESEILWRAVLESICIEHPV